MAPTRMTLGSLGLVLALAALLVGCGIKSAPLPATQAAPAPPLDLEARAVENGVAISFSLPAADSADRQVVAARLFYAYLPKEGDPACPPCPPVLRNHYDLNLTKHVNLMEGGRFTYLDTNAPMNNQAAYQIKLTDARGRTGIVSRMVRALRLELPAAPQGLLAELGSGQVELKWQPVKTLQSGAATTDKIGYIVYRRGADPARPLNERPMTQNGLLDKSVVVGQAYEYQVAAAIMIDNSVVVGRPSHWVKAAVRSMEPPSAPGGLVGASMEDGIYLRFTPSPQQDVAGYQVMRAKAKGGPWTLLNQDLNRENTFVDKEVKQGVIYWYRVVAVSEGGKTSPPSEALEVKHQP